MGLGKNVSLMVAATAGGRLFADINRGDTSMKSYPFRPSANRHLNCLSGDKFLLERTVIA